MSASGREWIKSEREGNENWKERKCKLGKKRMRTESEGWELREKGTLESGEMVAGKEGIETDS